MIDPIEILTAVALSHLWTHKLTQVDMVAGWWPGIVNAYLPRFAKFPLYHCSTCVCGFWYVVFHAATLDFTIFSLQEVIFAMFLTFALDEQ